MVNITEGIYAEIASSLRKKIDGEEYFNGVVGYDNHHFSATLRTTLMIYREKERIKEIVPVWWEFNTMLADGYALNDFSWQEFKPFLITGVTGLTGRSDSLNGATAEFAPSPEIS